MTNFDAIAVTLPGLADPAIAIAASRAGAIGVVDLSFVSDEQLATQAVTRLARFARNRCGIKLDSRDKRVADAVISMLPPAVTFAILTPAEHDLVREHAERLRAQGVALWLESTSLGEAQLACALGFDGVIAKGHEAGGRVSDTTTFVLLQQFRSEIALPVWAQGGIGEHTAAACAVAGAAGFVLDSQLALTRESRLPDHVKAVITRMEGTEPVCVGHEPGEWWRLYERPGYTAADELRGLECKIAVENPAVENLGPSGAEAWRARLAGLVGWAGQHNAWLLGQDACLAARLAKRFHTVGGVLEGIRQSVDGHLASVAAARPLAEHGPLARSHGTRYPIVQGPMTRVSDVPAFAREIASAGALPFLALALMRGPEVEALLRETQRELGGLPWGAGILGFVPHELRAEQMAVLERYPPSFALIAGGRPDQALRLERDGIPAYLHVPSPGLLKLFAADGARRFVFEGRECGGHVGPRTSFVLWNTMIDVLVESVPPGDLPNCHVLFAGGVHDAHSAAMVAAMAASLTDRGVKVGVLLGTAYLFTEEAVATGAITPTFQDEATSCTGTVLLETGPGHTTRCADTPFAIGFRQERQRLTAQGCSAEEIRLQLEMLNLGRARVASKGIDRAPDQGLAPDAPKFVTVAPEDQAARGMYMLGQAATLRSATMTLAELHHDVSVTGSALFDELSQPGSPRAATSSPQQPCDIAIIGMSCLLPKAPDLGAYWQNILDKVDAITEVPVDRWDPQRYFDPDPSAPDKIYSKWGGFLDPVPFDPVRYGMPPNTLPSIEPLHLLTLEAVRSALVDAGYLERPFARRQTGVIFGIGGIGDHGNGYGVRAGLPTLLGDVSAEILDKLPTWTEDSFPGILLNVAAGRVANRFDLGGVNYTVDAACAASLAAVYLAVGALADGSSDMMIVGGADTMQTPFGYLCFSKTHALSPRGRCRPLDAGADGIVISEGLGVLVLKRLADAERDGDRIYAVIKGIGGSSDGRDRSLTAPRPEGQALALERAYARAGFSPATVGLIEAHGTGTAAGDRAEIATLNQVFDAAGAPAQQCAVGSVKSMIGHTKGTAGVAGLIKVALGLHHKVLPPTLGVERPNPAVGTEDSPFYVNSERRPWLQAATAPPRRAGVSAFGFGGTNFHIALEEYTGDYLPGPAEAAVQNWPSELFIWTAGSREELRERVTELDRALAAAPVTAPLREVARAVWVQGPSALATRLAVVATSIDDLRSKLATARDALDTPQGQVWDRGGVYLTASPLAGAGAIAFLYPGQGSQHPDMLRDLAIGFPEVREAFELADAVLTDELDKPLSGYVFPPPAFNPDDEHARAAALRQTDRAQPALGAAGMGLSRLLAAVGVRPDLAAGHSYGEYAALCAAGAIDEEVLYRLSQARGRCILDASSSDAFPNDLGTMAAVSESPTRVQAVLEDAAEVWVANLNAPKQTVIAGTRAGIERAVGRLGKSGIPAKALNVGCAFHSPLVAPARDRFAEVLADVQFTTPTLAVYANTSAATYPTEPAQIADLLAEHLVRPVRFAEQLEQMYAAGARVFVEVGPGAVLTGLVGQVLGARPHLAVQTQDSGCGFTAFQHALAQLSAHGVTLDLHRLYEGRVARHLRLDALGKDLAPVPLPATTWMVRGGSAHPLHPAVPVQRSAPARPPAPVPATPERAPAPVPAAAARPPAPVPPTASPTPPPPPVPAAPAPAPVPAIAAHSVPVPGPLEQAQVGHDAIPLRFQQLMTKFLDVQQEVMMAYLHGSQNGSGNGSANGSGPAAKPPAQALRLPELIAPPVAEPTIPPVAAEPVAAPVPAAPEPPRTDQVAAELVRLVAERTGYPPEMLGLDIDMETDLGIDSIKRIEILAAATQSLQTDATQASPISEEKMETLAKARTLRALVEAFLALDPANSNGHVPTQPTAAPVAAPVAAAPQPPRTDQVVAELVRLVAERTGYPPEMLGLDIDMETDLGIDSIKRIEILAAATQSLQTDATQATPISEEKMETLAKARTLRALVEAFLALDPASSNGHSPPPTAPPPAPPLPAAPAVTQPVTQLGAGTTTNGTAPPSAGAEVPRFLPTVVDAPIGTATRPLPGVVAITDDEQGVATALAESLRSHGIAAALIQDRPGPLDIGLDEYAASLGDVQATRGLVETIRQRQGAISCLVHLLPLRAGPPFEALDVPAQQARLDLEARSLLHLAQAASTDLRRPGAGTQLLAAVRMDGAFGFHHTGSFQPSQGAMAGLVKTLASEWPEVRCKVVDLAPATPNAGELLTAELRSDDHQIEVGWSQGRRLAVRLVPVPLPTTGGTAPMITSDSVVLVVGGARGITSDVAREIARRFRPTMVIVGRSSIPEDAEPADTAGITEPRALKAALAARLSSPGSPATPAQVEPAYRRLLAGRQVRTNLLAITEAGARVHYHQLDVRDAEAVARLVEDVYTEHGRIDGVVYGAGIIEDKLIGSKTTESFDRVVQTKTVGAFALARALRPEGLKFLALFSSISARFGNTGQGDYAAANEVLNKLAAWLDARWPGRLVSLNWGPWKTAGMVSDEVERLMNERGVQLIGPESGVPALIAELERGRKGDVEVVLGAGPWRVATPLLDDAKVTQAPDGVALTRMLDPDRDLYLRDHCLDDHPVLPMTAAMELMAEAAAAFRPSYEVAELRGVQLLRGVILDGGPRPITVQTANATSVDGGVALDVTIADGRAERVAYRAGVILCQALPEAPPAPARSSTGLEPFPMTVEQAYEELLFHGPLMHGITQIDGINDEGMVATLRTSSPQRCVAGAGPGSWVVDPVLLDCGLQLVLLWARIRLDMTPLPTRIGSYRRFAALPEGPVRCHLRARVRAGGNILDSQLAFLDARGRLLVVMDGIETPGSRSLNRLAGAVSGGEGR